MTALSPDQIAAKWAQNLGGATASITAGVEAVRVSPGQLAARQQQAYVAGVTNNAQRWAQKVGSVSLSDWQQATINKGIPRIATGAQAAQGKFTQFMSTLMPRIASIQASLPPRGNIQQNFARSQAFGMALHQAYKGTSS